MNCWAPGNPNLLGLGQPHLGWVYHLVSEPFSSQRDLPPEEMDPKGKGIVINDKEKEFFNEPKDDKSNDS